MPDAVSRLRRALAAEGQASSDFDLNPGIVLPEGRRLTEAAVLVALRDAPGGLRLVLTKRSSRLKHHPGQIAFPGGKRDPGDESLAATALRESHEEIGLDPAAVELLGTLPPHETVTGFRVTPFVAWLERSFDPVCEPGEVDEVFDVPFAHVSDPTRYGVERRLWRGQWRSYYVVPWGPYYIWGATARMLRALATRLEP